MDVADEQGFAVHAGASELQDERSSNSPTQQAACVNSVGPQSDDRAIMFSNTVNGIIVTEVSLPSGKYHHQKHNTRNADVKFRTICG